MASDEDGLKRICPHCGTADAVRIGVCRECGRIVCTECGNSQFTANGKRIFHHECFRKADHSDAFTMIKIVK